MITFKQFLEADVGNLADMGAPTQDPAGGAPMGQPAPEGKQMKGSLTDNEKRVLALLSHNSLKSAPQRAREIVSGDQNMVQAVKGLKANFNAVDVTPGEIAINQTGIELAGKAGIVDPNTGELSDLGQQLATTTSGGAQNPKTKDLAAGGMGGAPMAPPGGDMGGLPPLESMQFLRGLL